jgi:hypothetical protein
MYCYFIYQMSKYSHKIELFVKTINPSINFADTFSDNAAINNIYGSILQSINDIHACQLIAESNIKPIHARDQHPLIYIFFRDLKKVGILDKLMPDQHIPDFDNFEIFVKWHREHIHSINFHKIHKLVDELSRGTNNNKYKNELIDMYRLLYEATGERKIFHDALYGNNFISLDILHDLESCDIEYKKYKINNKHTVDIFVPQYTQYIDGPNLLIVSVIIGFMEILAKKYNKDIPSVKLTIMSSSQKKIVHYGTKVLCCDNINSGSTYVGESIVCWRREEFYKVLIHELFHFYGFDFFNNDSYYDKLESMLIVPKIIGIDRLNECYTESITILIFNIFLCIIRANRDNKDMGVGVDSIIPRFQILIKNEISFLMFQVAKIIYIFNGRSFDDFLEEKIIIKQNTSFRSYFIIKLILLTNLNALLQLIDKGMVIESERLLEAGELINSSFLIFVNNKNNINIMNQLIGKCNMSREANSPWIYRTCRMSANDI